MSEISEIEKYRLFVKVVQEMRRQQQRFFGGERSLACVQEAKRLEKKVDRMLDALNGGDLFAED